MKIDEFGSALRRCGVRKGSGVPCSFFKPLVNYMVAEDDLDYVPAASEGEAVAIAAGMSAAGEPSFALMQNSGLGNAINPITSLLYPYQIGVSLFVSHRGQPGLGDEPQHERMGVITEELLPLCGIEGRLMNPESFEAELATALGASQPTGWVFRKGSLTGGPKLPTADGGFQARAPHQGHLEHQLASATREETLTALLPLLNGAKQGEPPAVISTTGKLSRELYELDDQEHDRSNRFYMVGSMGCAGAFGLGVARAHPGKVVVLDGDGALLMKLGTLATVGWMQPKRFHHVLIDNAVHESTGGQPTASPNVDFASVAYSAGYRDVATVATPAELLQTLERQMSTDGPTFVRMLVKAGSRADLGRPKLTPRQGYLRFSEFLREAR